MQLQIYPSASFRVVQFPCRNGSLSKKGIFLFFMNRLTHSDDLPYGAVVNYWTRPVYV